tara:strand:+ start:26567 stop:27640 length:1074 start_codon:yes stop_codon:yes gene_type:complete
MKKFKINFTDYITPNPVFIDGISKSGKLVIDNIVSHMDRMELISMRYITDTIFDFVETGLMDEDAALEIIGSQMDQRLWKNYLGRDLNTNRNDMSSVHSSRNPNDYFERMNRLDNDETYAEFLNSLKRDNPISPESTDDLFLKNDILLNHFKKLKFIVLFRHPLEIAYAWYINGRGTRYLDNDVRMGHHTYNVNGKNAPEFAISWAEEYHKILPIDRVLKSVYLCCSDYLIAYKNISNKLEEKILCLTFEKFVVDPEKYILEIEEFLGTERSPNTQKLLADQRVPRKFNIQEFSAKYLILKKNSTDSYFKLLIDVCKTYESTFKTVEQVDEVLKDIDLEKSSKYLNQPKFINGKAIW